MTPEQLKASILQYAIQGKLVEQRPEEGTGEELYRQIQAEKQRLIQEKKIKKEKPLAEISEDEIPFDIPESWKWVRVQLVTCLNPKNDLSDDLETSFIPMALVDDGYRNNHSFEIKTWGSIKKGFTHFADGDIGIAKITPCFQNRKSVIFRNLKNGYGAGTTELSIVRVVNELLSREFLLWFFKSAYFIDNGVKSFTGTAGQQRIQKDYLAMCVFPLPPLAEQKRIVAKIEELLPLVDRYAASYEKLEQFNAKFPEDMKKSILQYAIQGKLVEQRSEEGTGEELYRQIQTEKQRLIKEGKIKKEKPLAEIAEDEIPFDIPENWKWVQLGDLASINGGFAFKSTNYTTEGVRVIRISDFNETGFVNDKIVRYPYDDSLSQYVLDVKNILLCMTGGTVGKSLFITKLDEKMVVNQRVATIKVESVLPEYVYQVILAPITQKVIQDSKNSTNDNISMDTIKSFLIPLPPLAEQKRIVAKLEEILPLCEQLK